MGGAMRDARPPEAARLIAEILELADRLRERLDAPCDVRGISPSRFAVMETVQQSGEAGCSQTELADRLGLSESNVSALIEALRKTGLLFRFRSKADRRRSVLLLSESGEELVGLLSGTRQLVAESLMKGISPEQIAGLRKLLDALSCRLDDAKFDLTPSPNPSDVELRRAS